MKTKTEAVISYTLWFPWPSFIANTSPRSQDPLQKASHEVIDQQDSQDLGEERLTLPFVSCVSLSTRNLFTTKSGKKSSKSSNSHFFTDPQCCCSSHLCPLLNWFYKSWSQLFCAHLEVPKWRWSRFDFKVLANHQVACALHNIAPQCSGLVLKRKTQIFFCESQNDLFLWWHSITRFKHVAKLRFLSQTRTSWSLFSLATQAWYGVRVPTEILQIVRF